MRDDLDTADPFPCAMSWGTGLLLLAVLVIFPSTAGASESGGLLAVLQTLGFGPWSLAVAALLIRCWPHLVDLAKAGAGLVGERRMRASAAAAVLEAQEWEARSMKAGADVVTDGPAKLARALAAMKHQFPKADEGKLRHFVNAEVGRLPGIGATGSLDLPDPGPDVHRVVTERALVGTERP